MICSSSHILGIKITTFFRKMNHGFLIQKFTLIETLSISIVESRKNKKPGR
ncbi:hypothetical protein LEP1GSC166_0149 [Leptospira kirschneri]|nr:hypothetical protein LEP1GSC166_0149 [Leptospira kirschneri]